VNVSWSAAGPEIEWLRSAHGEKKYRKRYVRGCWFIPPMTIGPDFCFEKEFRKALLPWTHGLDMVS
jgi:hypothetical protein